MKVKFKSMSDGQRAFARGAGLALTVFPRATVTISHTTAVGAFARARKTISNAGREAERKVGASHDLAHAE